MPLRTLMAAVGFVVVFAVVLVGIYLPVPHFVFVVLSLVFIGPIAATAFAIGARWDARMAAKLACTAVPLGYAAGGLVGWANVPREWTASLWTTIDASMNAAKYGAAFEHTAEHALFYFLFCGILAALVTGVGAVVTTRTVARRRPAYVTRREARSPEP